jgi:hypothetical protein
MKTFMGKWPKEEGWYWYKDGYNTLNRVILFRRRRTSTLRKKIPKAYFISGTKIAGTKLPKHAIIVGPIPAPGSRTTLFLAEISGGVEITIHGPYSSRKEHKEKSQEIRNDQDPGTDSLFALELDYDGTITDFRAPGEDPTFEDKEAEDKKNADN